MNLWFLCLRVSCALFFPFNIWNLEGNDSKSRARIHVASAPVNRGSGSLVLPSRLVSTAFHLLYHLCGLVARSGDQKFPLQALTRSPCQETVTVKCQMRTFLAEQVTKTLQTIAGSQKQEFFLLVLEIVPLIDLMFLIIYNIHFYMTDLYWEKPT